MASSARAARMASTTEGARCSSTVQPFPSGLHQQREPSAKPVDGLATQLGDTGGGDPEVDRDTRHGPLAHEVLDHDGPHGSGQCVDPVPQLVGELAPQHVFLRAGFAVGQQVRHRVQDDVLQVDRVAAARDLDRGGHLLRREADEQPELDHGRGAAQRGDQLRVAGTHEVEAPASGPAGPLHGSHLVHQGTAYPGRGVLVERLTPRRVERAGRAHEGEKTGGHQLVPFHGLRAGVRQFLNVLVHQRNVLAYQLGRRRGRRGHPLRSLGPVWNGMAISATIGEFSMIALATWSSRIRSCRANRRIISNALPRAGPCRSARMPFACSIMIRERSAVCSWRASRSAPRRARCSTSTLAASAAIARGMTRSSANRSGRRPKRTSAPSVSTPCRSGIIRMAGKPASFAASRRSLSDTSSGSWAASLVAATLTGLPSSPTSMTAAASAEDNATERRASLSMYRASPTGPRAMFERSLTAATISSSRRAMFVVTLGHPSSGPTITAGSEVFRPK